MPALGLCGLLMGILLFDANLSLTGDNAQFINLGRSLADGHGLSETIEGPNPSRTPNTPSDFRSSSPLPTSSSPDNLIALKSLVVLLYAISIPLTYLLIRRFAAPPIALGASALCLASPLLLDYSHQVMSEIPFLTIFSHSSPPPSPRTKIQHPIRTRTCNHRHNLLPTTFAAQASSSSAPAYSSLPCTKNGKKRASSP